MSRIQAWDRTMLSTGLAYMDGVTHNYTRRGTTALFDALDLLRGGAVAQCKPRYRS